MMRGQIFSRCKGRWVGSCLALVAGFGLEALAVAHAATPVDAGYLDFSYGSCTSAVTGEKPESKLWFNDGVWWGSLCNGTVNKYRIHKLDPATQDWADTGTQIDDRASSKADTLWEGVTQKLYVVSHKFTTKGAPSSTQSNWGRLYRYSYNPVTKTYSLDAGFPVNVTQGISETLTVAKDTTGTLWVTYVESSQVMINHSLNGDDTQWGTPFALPVPGTATASDDISAVVPFDGRIGVMWSNQSTKKMYWAQHIDGAGDTAADWQSTAVYAPAGSGADDHINLKTLPPGDSAGIVFAATKTSFSSSTQPQENLLVCMSSTGAGCASSSNWQAHQVYTVGDGATRPIVLIDTGTRTLNFLDTNSGSGGHIRRKTADLDNIQFPSGQGTPFIRDTAHADINNVTSTKQNLDSVTGLVGLASNGTTNFYYHNSLSLGSGPDISVSPSTHSYGSVTVGSSASKTFVVSNDGTADLNVTATTLGGTDAAEFSIVSGGAPFTLSPGQTQNVAVSFNPSSAGAKSASLDIASNDPDESPLDVALSGTGTTPAPDITVTPANHNYGSVTVGSSASKIFVVSNDGTANLNVSSTTVVGTDPSQFNIDSGGEAFTLTPGQTRNVAVSFNPSSAGAKSASLRFASDDPDENPLDVALTGTGSTGAPTVITHEEIATGGSTSSTTVSTAGSLTGVSGQLYLAAIATKGNITVSSVSGLGLTWTLVSAQCAGRGQSRVEVWQAQGTPAGNGAVTATLQSAPSNAVIAVSRYSGVSTTSPLGNIVSGNTLGFSGACSGGADSSSYSFDVATTVTGAMVYGAVTMRGKTHTPGTGYTERVEFKQGSAGSEASVAVEDMGVSSASTVPVNGTLSGIVDWAMVGLEIRP